MKVLSITELPDGSANIEFEFTDEETKLLLNYAINKILISHINNLRDEGENNE